MDEQIDDINLIIIRYLDGSASLEEKAQLLWWLKGSDQNRSEFTDTQDLWLSCNAMPGNELEINIALEKLRSRIMEMQPLTTKPGLHLSFRKFQAVAMILLLLGMGYLLSLTYFTQPETIVQNQLITAKGSKGKFTLPDGSIVWLNAESQLNYPEKFSSGKREVTLKGGAYFEVEKNKEKPFIVHIGKIDIEVVGTSFSISDYDTHELFKAALLEGSIRLSSPNLKEQLTLKPGQLFEYNKKENKLAVRSVNAQLYTNWIKEKLMFDNNKLSDVITSLEGWYNVQINCPKDFAANTRMSFTVRGENIEEILQAMGLIIPIQYDITDNKVTIRPKK